MPCPPADSLEACLIDLKGQGASVVLSMLPDREAEALGVSEDAALCATVGLTFQSFPIADFGLPDLTGFQDLVGRLRQMLEAGEALAVHCRAGIGRTGMVAACLLVATGLSADKAIREVSAARGVSVPDTVEQAAFIHRFAQTLRQRAD